MKLFEAQNISVAYNETRLSNVSFSLEAGKIYDLVGPSGAGKSMLLSGCARMLPLLSGSLFLEGENSSATTAQIWRTRVALVPQHAVLLSGTVRDNLLFPWSLKANANKSKPTEKDMRTMIEVAALNVELDRPSNELSGGQIARVALLRTFLTKPSVLLLDEVDAALDRESALAVGKLTFQLVEEGACALRVRHHESDGFASTTFALEDGQLRVSANKAIAGSA